MEKVYLEGDRFLDSVVDSWLWQEEQDAEDCEKVVLMIAVLEDWSEAGESLD